MVPRKPPGDGAAPAPGKQPGHSSQQQQTIHKILHYLDTFCTTGAVVSQLVATWAQTRNDALGGKLATDAYQLAVDVHAFNERLAEVLEGTGQQ